MALADDIRNALDKVDQNQARWVLVAVGVIILLRLRLILFAAALPLMAYWHYSNQLEEQQKEEEEEQQEPQAGGDAADADADVDDDLGPDMGDTSWPARDDLDDDLFQDNAKGGDAFGLDGKDGDPYDKSFWGDEDAKPKAAEPAPKRSTEPSTAEAAPWRSPPTKKTEPPAQGADDLDDILRLGEEDDEDLGLIGARVDPAPAPKKQSMSWDAQIGADDDFLGGPHMSLKGGPRDPLADDGFRPGAGNDLDDPLAGLGGLGGGLDEFDFLGGGDDMDALFGGMGGGKGKGKGKGKSKDKGPMEPRGPNPKQVFVANVGDLSEDDIRNFFEEVGEVDRLKVLRNPDGGSKGVCFVTFRTEEQAQKALTLHGTQLEGRSLVVRLAHGGKGTEKGEDKGKGKGDGPLDLGGSERFSAAFGGERDRESAPRSKGKGGKGGKGRGDRGEMDELLEEALQHDDGPLKPGDFDFAARRFLTELRSRDKSDGTQRFQEAIDMVLKYTSSKDRSSVRKWPAYVFTLLQKFDPGLQEEIRERDADRRMQKGGGGMGGRMGRGDDRERETPTSNGPP